ncbi:scavenger receptor class F member 1-like [Haliotis rufescens]|uniref:scavenger receptor class F member 1-like n=1 Tax=Haliotis rufescens TaxID=6454 RepID=UPI00201F3E9A|nr:scavenger receptor class F member 1-like [Haliotis rufescens]
MTSVILCITFTVVAIKASPCKDNQHCSDCDITTGHCLTECDIGYFDLKCLSVCDGYCKYNLCSQSDDGGGRCTEGCVPGYQGRRCNIPCDSPGGNCTACPGGCDGGYCQLGSFCVSGCEDSYYGSGCYNTCNTNCRPNPFTLDEQSSMVTKSDCNKMSGDCIYGCKEGWYGPRCSSQYSKAEILYAVKVGLPTTALLVVFLAVCCRFCKCGRCQCCSQAETARGNREDAYSLDYLDSDWSCEIEQEDAVMDHEGTCMTQGDGKGCKLYDETYSSPEASGMSDRREVCDVGYSSPEATGMSDRREVCDVGYSSPVHVYDARTAVNYISPVQDRR